MSRQLFVMTLFLFAFIFHSSGQSLLYLKKVNSAKRKTVFINQEIKVKTVNDSVYKGTLYSITSDAIMIDDKVTLLKDIDYIKVYNIFGKSVGKSLQVGSVVFLGIFTFNSLIQQLRPIITQGNWYFLGGLMLSGIIIELISAKKYRLNKNWKVEPLLIPE